MIHFNSVHKVQASEVKFMFALRTTRSMDNQGSSLEHTNELGDDNNWIDRYLMISIWSKKKANELGHRW